MSVKPSGRQLTMVVALLALAAGGVFAARAISSGDALPLRVELESRAVSKLPFLIAADQGLYERYGLNVDLRMPSPDVEGGLGRRSLVRRGLDRLLRRSWQREVFSNGATPEIFGTVNDLARSELRLLASTDCIIHSKIVGQHGMENVEELRGKRIGVTSLMQNLTSFTVLELAERMGWDPVHDISIILRGNKLEALREGHVDAIVASSGTTVAEALEEGFPILLDTRSWGSLPWGGNSVRVEAAWLEDGVHQEAARRFLKALVEGVALFHEDRELALDVLQRWNGVSREDAEIIYGTAAMPRVPYPCYEGIRRTMEVYDSHAMRAYSPEDFYDDRILKELDESGFIDSVYAAIRQAR